MVFQPPASWEEGASLQTFVAATILSERRQAGNESQMALASSERVL